MLANIGARTLAARLGRLGATLYRGLMSHPSVVASGVTPENLIATWDALSATAAAIAAKLLTFVRLTRADLLGPAPTYETGAIG